MDSIAVKQGSEHSQRFGFNSCDKNKQCSERSERFYLDSGEVK